MWSYLYWKDKQVKLLEKMQQGLLESNGFSSPDYLQGAEEEAESHILCFGFVSPLYPLLLNSACHWQARRRGGQYTESRSPALPGCLSSP